MDEKNRSTTMQRVSLPAIVHLPWHNVAKTMLALPFPRMNLWVGPPGTGKTTYANYLALTLTGQPPVVLAGSPSTEPSHFWGHFELAGDETVWRDGALSVSLRSQRPLVIEDFSLIPVEVRADLLPARDQSTITNPITKETLPIGQWRCICTSNSEALTCRKNSGIAAVLYDGFQILEIPDLHDDQVGQFLEHQFPQTSRPRLKQVMKLWSEYRDISSKGASARSYLSYRAAAHLTALLEAGLDENTAVTVALCNKLLPLDEDLFSVAQLKNQLDDGRTDSDDEEGNA
jgi:hypothetical protein